MTAATEARPLADVTMDDLRALIAGLEDLSDRERAILNALAESYGTLLDALQDKNATIAKLRSLLFGASTETRENVRRQTGKEPPPEATAPTEGDSASAKKAKRKGHGRLPASAYHGAETVEIPHESLKAGDPCPKPFCSGTLYRKEPIVFIRICGCSPFAATRYEQDRLRCGLCGEIFKAVLPPEVGTDESKFDESATSMTAVLRYGYGLPMNRIEDLQDSFGAPFPASTQWDLLNSGAERIRPVIQELVRQAAQGSVVMNDDTPMKILSFLVEKRRRKERGEKPPKRTGIYTSGVVSDLADGRRIVLYFTGNRHAGENLARVLSAREAGRTPPIQMCDGLRHNTPAELEVILSNCLVHARRHFVDIASSFPDEVDKVINDLAAVYRNDALTRGMSAADRLRFHQEHSASVMAELKAWMDEQISEKKAEPNSRLGKAIDYSLERWKQLTLFLREPGAPLDNSLTERMLKRAIRHRNNSLFYKTENGAEVGDLYMSLIATAKLAGADPFLYLNALQRHATAVASTPAEWMPWNYGETLTHAGPGP